MTVLLLVRIGATLAALAAWWVLLADDPPATGLRIARRLGLVAPEPELPRCKPVEQSLADLARIRADLQQAPPWTPQERVEGWLAAYDDVLVSVCRCLEHETRLGSLPRSVERELERQRVERLLVRDGLLEPQRQ